MKSLLLIIAIIAPTFAHAGYHSEKPKIEWPEHKYDVGDCLTPTNTTWGWYGATAMVDDVVFSKATEAFVYVLYMLERQNIGSLSETYKLNLIGYSTIVELDENTVKVFPCPNYEF